MKRISLVLSLGLSLCAGTVNVQAHGGHWGGGFWPFWGFGLGLGLGTALSYPAYGCAYSYPAYTYTYAPPVYTYPSPVYSYNSPAATVPAPAPAPPPQPPSAWRPSSPGTGHWVPDPTPYSYVPSRSVIVAAAPQVAVSPPVVAVARSAGGVPVYTLSP